MKAKALLISFLLAGCMSEVSNTSVTTPFSRLVPADEEQGVSTEEISWVKTSFRQGGAKTVLSIEPHMAHSRHIAVGGAWSSLQPEDFFLNISYISYDRYRNISNVKLIIDGQSYTLKPGPQGTNYRSVVAASGYLESEVSFRLDIDRLNDIINATTVEIGIVTLEGYSSALIFSPEKSTKAYSALKRLNNRIEKVQGPRVTGLD